MGAKNFKFFFPLFRFFLSRLSLVRGLWGNIYSLAGRDGSIPGGMNTLKVEEVGELRWDELTKCDGDLQAFVNTLFLFFSMILFFKTLSKPFLSFVGTLFGFFLPTFGSLFENSSVSGPTYYPSTTHLSTYYRTWEVYCASWNICRPTSDVNLCRGLESVGVRVS